MNKDFFITLSKKNFLKNIENIIKKTGKSVAPVIKSNAYGHGIKEIIKILLELPVIERVCVAYITEAQEAKKYGWKKQIIVMSPTTELQYNNQYEYFLYSFDFLDQMIKKYKKNKYKIHIKIDVGLNRLGFREHEIDLLLSLLSDHKEKIEVIGICTHLPRVNYDFTDEIKNQMKLFIDIVNKVKNFFPQILVHPFSSKAIPFIKKFESYCDFLRLGGSIYGLLNSEQKTKLDFELKQIITIKAKIISIKSVKKDSYVGYGIKGMTTEDTNLAVTSFGYGYGLIANFSECYGYYNKMLFPVIGLVAMNNITFNLQNSNNSPVVGDYMTLTSIEHPAISAGNISYHFAGGREYYFTAFLHPNIKRYIF